MTYVASKPTTDLSSAIAAWKQLLGPNHVITETAELTAAETATFATTQQIPVILYPDSREALQTCLKIANQYKTPVYPISTGKNWGYGSRVPTQSNCVLIDLRRLDRIVDFNEKLGYVTVEPGVTQRQLFEYLEAKQSNLLMSMTGSTPDSSLIGNIAERGEAKGPLGDRFAHVCALEVVLPTGECIHTGFDRFSNAKATPVHRWGVGPHLEGMFTQSNLGIITQMTMWLMPKPKYFQAFFYAIKDPAQLEELIEALQQLRMEGLINTTFHLNNDYRMLSLQQQFPWETTQGKAPLPTALLRQLSKNWGGGVWIGEGALYSVSKAQGKIERKLIQKALKRIVSKLMFFDQSVFNFMQAISPIYERFTGIAIKDKADLIYNKNPQRGIPTEKVLKMSYWRKKTPMPANPDLDLDRCGMLWCMPAVPFDGEHVRAALSIIESVFATFKFEPNIGLNCLSERNININAAIFFDREVPGEDQKALDCHDEMMRQLIAAGYLPYRLSNQAMDMLPPARDDYNPLLAKLKATLDPNNILAPGRYDFS